MDREDRAIRTAYFLRIPNVGDRIPPSIVRALTGRPARHFSGQHQPHLIAAGSVMAGAAGFSHIWGTGVMHRISASVTRRRQISMRSAAG